MKACPKCGLVHADADFICRRCRVDLLTGEPVAVAAQVMIKKPAFDSRKLTTLPLKLLRGLVGLGSRINAKTVGAIQKRFIKKPLQASRQAQISEMTYCMQCGGHMEPLTQPYYPGKTLYLFLILALLLFGLGFKWHGLFATAGLSVGAFFVYRSIRINIWKCGTCKHEVDRVCT